MTDSSKGGPCASMRLLAIDTATENCSACYYDGRTGEFDEISEVSERRHANLILEMVDTLSRRHGFRLPELDALCYGMGPGSFTGVRIAVSAAQGLALGAGLRVIGVSTLQALAAAGSGMRDGICVSAIDARMGEVYLGIYGIRDGQVEALLPDCVLSPEAAAQKAAAMAAKGVRTFCAGTGIGILEPLDKQNIFYKNCVKFPSGRSILDIIVLSNHAPTLTEPQDAMPLYIRDEVAWKKLAGSKTG